jgi:uncharacterized membrane protein YedE/YeeE
MPMDISFIIGIACLAVGVCALVFRSNAVYMLLALCGGFVLADLVAQDLTQIINSVVNINVPVFSYVQMVLLLILPLILLLMYRKSAGVALVLQIVPIVAFILLSFMFVTDMLPYDIQNQVKDSQTYNIVQPYFELAIAAGMLASLFYFWSKKPHREKHGKKHKK